MEEQILTFKKDDLLTKLKANRLAHYDIHEKATAEFRRQVMKRLEQMMEKSKKGVPQLMVGLSPPTSYIKDYDAIIAMLGMTIETEIELTEQQFRQYIMDDWRWKREFITSNSSYVAISDQDQ